MPASHQRSMTFAANRDEVFQACMKAVSQCGFRVAESTYDNYSFYSKIGAKK